MRSDGSFYLGAAVGRRGHVETAYLDPTRREPRGVPERCPTCGARVLVACTECGLRIRGDYHVPGVIGVSSPNRPSFCDGCGAAFPWATRQERIYELENLLDEEVVDEADRVAVLEQLQRLREDEHLSEKDERQAWETIKRRAGGALKSPSAQRLIEGIVSAAIRHQLGI